MVFCFANIVTHRAEEVKFAWCTLPSHKCCMHIYILAISICSDIDQSKIFVSSIKLIHVCEIREARKPTKVTS